MSCGICFSLVLQTYREKKEKFLRQVKLFHKFGKKKLSDEDLILISRISIYFVFVYVPVSYSH